MESKDSFANLGVSDYDLENGMKDLDKLILKSKASTINSDILSTFRVFWID